MSLDPVVLFFALGLAAGVLKADLRLPPAIYEFVSTLLLLSIGMKGGIELARQPAEGLAGDLMLTLVLGILLTFLAFFILRGIGRLDRSNAAAVAAHYGSVSIGTFAVGVAFLGSAGIRYEPTMPLLLVLLEIPAIVLGILLARGLKAGSPWGEIAREVLLGRSVLLLLGGLFIGWAAGPKGLEPMAPLFFDLFKGILAVFLLEMGLIAADHLGGFRRYGLFMGAFALLIPPAFALIGLGFAVLMGLSLGGAILLATLAASASYIAAPAAMRSAVPEANPALSLTAALAITFPFNILVGIPLYRQAAEWLLIR
ncbi:MAG: sodium-dependent bicarbonate transport family permease [Gammaproteobacteria bacterium]|nr:sodium-dependent bicarbonate transport family permease [Gammaproteobacteria bacterium]MBM4210346.1 sodium-dependent bicarbonate transport family permease [Gammaproteobacteria bacterium]MBM4225479.1 sodium-dependent bicarbonate transport family permease [Gammaproteobacteria bacterium]MBM4231378.1 sodium-dependent bicarbonate transport family permease [Gammaproteobacteria bacterium]